jgi:hypothetical protein
MGIERERDKGAKAFAALQKVGFLARPSTVPLLFILLP